MKYIDLSYISDLDHLTVTVKKHPQDEKAVFQELLDCLMLISTFFLSMPKVKNITFVFQGGEFACMHLEKIFDAILHPATPERSYYGIFCTEAKREMLQTHFSKNTNDVFAMAIRKKDVAGSNVTLITSAQKSGGMFLKNDHEGETVTYHQWFGFNHNNYKACQKVLSKPVHTYGDVSGTAMDLFAAFNVARLAAEKETSMTLFVKERMVLTDVPYANSFGWGEFVICFINLLMLNLLIVHNERSGFDTLGGMSDVWLRRVSDILCTGPSPPQRFSYEAITELGWLESFNLITVYDGIKLKARVI